VLEEVAAENGTTLLEMPVPEVLEEELQDLRD
jgi:hypothetical protein